MRTQYNREFKIQAVQMIMDQKKPVTQAARELELSRKTLHNGCVNTEKIRNRLFLVRGI